MHPSFESLIVTCALDPQTSLMDIHHDTSLRFILEDDSISSTSRARIYSCSSKGAWLWLVVRPSIYSFCIAHFSFTSTLRFRFGLIQPSTFNLFTCECGHNLDASNMDLACCLFGGQQITTHDAVQNVMYAFLQESGRTVWKERWYALTSGISL